jgi:dienelactone hydrolase
MTLDTLDLDYADGALPCRGWLVRDAARHGRQPGVVVFPDVRGVGEHARECARRLAEHGTVVLVADLYGGAPSRRNCRRRSG